MIQSIFSDMIMTILIVMGTFAVIFAIAFLLYQAWEQLKPLVQTFWYWINNSDPNSFA